LVLLTTINKSSKEKVIKTLKKGRLVINNTSPKIKLISAIFNNTWDKVWQAKAGRVNFSIIKDNNKVTKNK
jgi:hypothetical protein